MMLGIDPDHSMGSRSCKGKKLEKDFGTKVPMGEILTAPFLLGSMKSFAKGDIRFCNSGQALRAE